LSIYVCMYPPGAVARRKLVRRHRVNPISDPGKQKNDQYICIYVYIHTYIYIYMKHQHTRLRVNPHPAISSPEITKE